MRYGWVATRGQLFVGACMNELDDKGGQCFRVRKWLKAMAGRPGIFIHACNTQKQVVAVTSACRGHVPQDRPKDADWRGVRR